MRFGVSLALAAALAGCTALTGFDDYRFGTGPANEPDGGSLEGAGAAADAGSATGDGGPGAPTPDAQAPEHMDPPAPTAPMLASVSGSWLVDRDLRSSECNAPSFEGYTWTVIEEGGRISVLTNSPAGSVQNLSGTRSGASLELTGLLTGNAGVTNTVTMKLMLSSDGDTFVGDESSVPRCPTTRRVVGTRL